MKVLSIRQPWAWLIVVGWKDIENRTWSTAYRGPLLIHASKQMSLRDYLSVKGWLESVPWPGLAPVLPPPGQLQFGGVVGSAGITDCVSESASPWFFGPHGFCLAGQRPCEFIPMRGRLGLFEAPAGLSINPVRE